MYRLVRHGVGLCFEDVGRGAPPLVLIHDLGHDHASFTPQIEHFRRTHRVVAVDLRGHGRSDKPDDEYTMASFADDVAWVCYELGVYSPVVVGHGLGGAIAFEMGARYPALPAALVALDSLILPPPDTRITLHSMVECLNTTACRDILERQVMEQIRGSRSVAVQRRNDLVEGISRASSRAVASGWENALAWNGAMAAVYCRVPVLYVDGGTRATDLSRLRELRPQLTVERTETVGHFQHLEAAENVNAIIERYVESLRMGTLAEGAE